MGNSKPQLLMATAIITAFIAAFIAAFTAMSAGCSQADPTSEPTATIITTAAPALSPATATPAATAMPEGPGTEAPEPPTAAPEQSPAAAGNRAPPEAPAGEPDGRTETGSQLTEEPSDQPGRPSNQEDLLDAIRALTPEERDCLPPDVRDGWVSLELDSVVGTHHARILKQVADCVSDEDIVRLMIIPVMEEEIALTPEEKECLAAGNSGRMVRKALETDGEYPVFTDALFVAIAGTFINTQDCLGEERSKQMDISQELAAIIRCIVQDAQGAERLTTAIVEQNEEVMAELEKRVMECAQQFPPQQLVEPPECGREGVDPGAPCRER